MDKKLTFNNGEGHGVIELGEGPSWVVAGGSQEKEFPSLENV